MKDLKIQIFFTFIFFMVLTKELDEINHIDVMECPNQCNLNGLCEMHLHKSVVKNKEEYIEQYYCKCFGSFSGESCGNCSFGHFGSRCLSCPGFENDKACHGNGVCSDGINGTGKCICHQGYDVNLDCQLMRPLEEGFMLTNRKISFLVIAALSCVFVIFALHYFPILNILPKSLAAITVGFVIGLLIKLIIEENEYEESEIIPKAFFVILLPPIIFYEGFSLDKVTFFKNIGTILLFAFCGTLISCLIFALIIYFSSLLEIIDEISFVEAIMFGGLISCVDSELILSLFKKFNSNISLNMLVYGENVLKESFSITIYRIFCVYIVEILSTSKSKDIHIPIFDLIYVFFGSLLIGFIVAGTCSFALKILDFSNYPQIEIAFFILYCYLPYPICEGLGLSGIIGTLFASMIMNNFAFYSLSPINQISSTSVIKCSAFVTEEFCYVYLGIQLPSAFKGFSISFLFISVIAMMIARAAEVYPITNICNRFRQHKLEHNHKFTMWFFALKGTIPFALAIGFPTSNNKLITSTTQLIILFSIIILGGLSQIFIQCFNIFKIEDTVLVEQKEIMQPSSRQSNNTLSEENLPRNTSEELSHGIKVFPGQSFREIIINNFWKIENFLRKNDWVKRKERATQMMAEADQYQ